MMIEVLKSKLHCVRVTEANLNYMGSITIDEDLMDAANMIAGEKVHIVDNNNGAGYGENTIIAFYTSHRNVPGGQSQVQSMAYSTDNGRTYTK